MTQALREKPNVQEAERPRELRPFLALAFGVFGLGFSAIFVRLAGAPGPVSGFYRMGIAALIMALPFARQLRRGPRLPAHTLALAAFAGLFFALDLAAWNTSVLMTSAANATLLGNTAPLWVSLGAVLLFKEKLARSFWAGLALSLTGAAVILGQDFLAHATLGAGDLLAILGGLFYGIFLLATQQARGRLDSLTSWWVSAASSALVLLIISLLLGHSLIGYSAATYWNLLGLALVTQIAAFLCINYALGHLSASYVSPTLLGQPVITAVLGVPLLNQPITPLQILGGVIALAGILLVHSRR